MIDIFLGNPSEKIKQWIIEHQSNARPNPDNGFKTVKFQDLTADDMTLVGDSNHAPTTYAVNLYGDIQEFFLGFEFANMDQSRGGPIPITQALAYEYSIGLSDIRTNVFITCKSGNSQSSGSYGISEVCQYFKDNNQYDQIVNELKTNGYITIYFFIRSQSFPDAPLSAIKQKGYLIAANKTLFGDIQYETASTGGIGSPIIYVNGSRLNEIPGMTQRI